MHSEYCGKHAELVGLVCLRAYTSSPLRSENDSLGVSNPMG